MDSRNLMQLRFCLLMDASKNPLLLAFRQKWDSNKGRKLFGLRKTKGKRVEWQEMAKNWRCFFDCQMLFHSRESFTELWSTYIQGCEVENLTMSHHFLKNIELRSCNGKNAYHIKIFCLKHCFSLTFTAIVQYINKLRPHEFLFTMFTQSHFSMSSEAGLQLLSCSARGIYNSQCWKFDWPPFLSIRCSMWR